METEQIDRRVTWLDEQRRKDAEELTRLEERIEALDQSIRQQAKQIRDLASESARTSALEARVRQFDESLSKHRSEISQQLETLDGRRIAREKQLESMRLIDQKGLSEDIDEIRERLRDIDELQEALEARKQEELRVSRKLDEYEKNAAQLDSEVQAGRLSVVGVREAARQEAGQLDDLETRTDALAKRTDAQRVFMDTAEDHLRRLETRASQLEASEQELRRSQSLWTEQQAARLGEFDRAWKVWEKRFMAFEQQSEELQDRMQAYEETHRGLQNLRDDLKEVVETLERRISEVSEMYRLSEDRFKQEWSKFEADEKKRWGSFKLSAEELWKEHRRVHASMVKELEGIHGQLDRTQTDVRQIQLANFEKISDIVAVVQDWAAEIEKGEYPNA